MVRKLRKIALLCLLLACSVPVFSSDTASLFLRGTVPCSIRIEAKGDAALLAANVVPDRLTVSSLRFGGTVHVFVSTI